MKQTNETNETSETKGYVDTLYLETGYGNGIWKRAMIACSFYWFDRIGRHALRIR